MNNNYSYTFALFLYNYCILLQGYIGIDNENQSVHITVDTNTVISRSFFCFF